MRLSINPTPICQKHTPIYFPSQVQSFTHFKPLTSIFSPCVSPILAFQSFNPGPQLRKTDPTPSVPAVQDQPLVFTCHFPVIIISELATPNPSSTPPFGMAIKGSKTGHCFGNAHSHRGIVEDTLRNVVANMEAGFLSFVEKSKEAKPEIVCSGTCCLIGVIWKGTLILANLGNSKAVLGSRVGRKMSASVLTDVHDVRIEEVRQQLTVSHPKDRDLVCNLNGTYSIKGVVKVTKSIGDAYLKDPKYKVPQLLKLGRFQFRSPLIQYPALTTEPAVSTRVLEANDRFLIFASNGFFEHLSYQEAVDIVHKNPRKGIAARLLKKAQKEAAKKVNFPYQYLEQISVGDKRRLHDDITVVVVFINSELLGHKADEGANLERYSYKGLEETGPSSFTKIEHLM